MHNYPGPGMPKLEAKRASVLGEFGGLGLPLAGHVWVDDPANWGYQNFKTKEELNAAYALLIRRLRLLIGEGLSAAVYTQTTDVEVEVNGLMTYDRAVHKISLDHAALHRQLYAPPPRLVTVVPTSEEKPQTWQFTTIQPAADWTKPDFDTTGWMSGPGGFGTAMTPGSVVRTEWKTPDLWLRRSVTLPEDKLHQPLLRIHHDEDVEIFVDGVSLAKLSGYTTNYTLIPLEDAAARVLRPGQKITLAVHCKQTGGGQYLDVGILDAVPDKP
jgi:hypothetical protein